jgi:hypothetical protein
MITVRCKKIIELLGCSVLLSVSVNDTIAAERWGCDLDLHQGDTGILEFTRSDSTIEGRTVVTRNTGAGPFENSISGSWRGDVIEFRRVLNPPTSHQGFKGIAVRTEDATNRPTDMRPDDPKVRMAGRFAFKYSGLWSADCRPAATTYRTGHLEIEQTWLADLDTGTTGGPRSQADIWFEAETATQRFITPRNGAVIGIAGTRSIGKSGCRALPMSRNRIPISSTPVGTYVCVGTNQGRISQFRINQPVGPSPGKLIIGFTTWEQ